ncbi:ABC transporter ATP-binding protein [Butyrivibrio sp. INlla21]|uniref:ABC transporter ATP-binding protein n=1 Tax=Butyrivibrio sp. INlla21 TaxID=1520811 RepID=UPI001FA893C8|nr:ABC transporter ATP-binding protein [Butyrivibrio sp. INlla21]
MIFFVISMICSVLVTFFELVSPKFVQYTVDFLLVDAADSSVPSYIDHVINMLGGRDYLRVHLYLMALVVAGCAIATALFRYLFKLFNSIAAEKFTRRMRDTLFEHIIRLPFAWHSENHTGDIIQRCTSDVDTIKNFVSEQMINLFRITVRIAVAMYFMLGISGYLTIFSAVFIPIIVLYSCLFHRRISKGFEKADSEEGRLSATAQENLTGVRVVRAFGREAYEKERFETQNYHYTNLWIDLIRTLSAFWASNDLISGLQVMLVTIIGAVLCVQNSITVGEYIAFVSLNAMLTWPVRALGRIISEMSKAGVSIDRLRYIMNSEEEKDSENAVEPPMNRDIVFDNVSYKYGNGTEDVLSNVSFRIKAGTTFGVLGGTGSGKSTLMYLMDKLYDLPASKGDADIAVGHVVTGDAAKAECHGGVGDAETAENSGRITIGDVDIKDIRRSYLRRNIGLVLQEPFLFSGTLSENIAITQSDASFKEVRDAAKIADLDEAIRNFNKGYETYVGERGVTLSGGQKQRTAIAQMLMGKPPIMIFDDSLSAVDTRTDARIRKALSETTVGTTVILISHRITTLMHADTILVLDKGKVAEIGSHDELVANNGIYKRIYDIQKQGI